jgi:hypothetical protein
MAIHVTPIPQLVELAAPAFTLGTANAAGSAVTAVASDSTLLTFDVTDPAAVAASAVVGTATTAPRRDHVHAGVGGAGTVVDEAITRFNGTGGASLQGYSSLSPTISDAGIVSLTSGALKFPATAIASADANTLDDYEEGSWTVGIGDDDSSATDKGQTYHSTTARYIKIGRIVSIAFDLNVNSLGTLTTSENARILGFPFTNQGNLDISLSAGPSSGLDITAGNSVNGAIMANTTFSYYNIWTATTGTARATVAEVSSNAMIIMGGTYLASA